jgi:hypothetical protein
MPVCATPACTERFGEGRHFGLQGWSLRPWIPVLVRCQRLWRPLNLSDPSMHVEDEWVLARVDLLALWLLSQDGIKLYTY